MTKLFKPKINNSTPAAAPEPPKIEAPTRELGDEGDRKEQVRRARGRNSLRIDPQTGGVGRGGTGVNIPLL